PLPRHGSRSRRWRRQTSATDMRLSSHLLTSMHSRRRGTATFQAVVLVLLALVPAVLSLAIPRPAKAAGPPTVTKVEPNSGPVAGGTSVTITGTNLTGATAVKFGSTSASVFTVNSATSIIATSPPGVGIVDVTVTTPGGTSPNTPADQ